MKCAIATARRRFCSLRATESPTELYARMLRKCGDERDLEQGRQIHDRILRGGMGIAGSVFLGNLLVQMYGKCGSTFEARAAFDAMLQRNVFSWTLLMGAYAQNGYNKQVMQVYWQMLQRGIKVDNQVIFLLALAACSKLGKQHLQHGKAVHMQLLHSGLVSEMFHSAIVNMYGKCGSVADAEAAFAASGKGNVTAWSAMIGAYTHNGHPHKALQVFDGMDVEPNSVTFLSVIEACSCLENLEQGKRIYDRIAKYGMQSQTVVGNALIGMFGKCGSLQDAFKVFSGMQRDVISWNCMITAYAQNGHCEKAMELYRRMGPEGMKANGGTFIAALSLCAQLGDLPEGRRVHAQVVESGCFSDITVQNGVLNMLGKCGRLSEARDVFETIRMKNSVTWNSMLASYARTGHARDALELYKTMDANKKDLITFTTVLYACASISALEDGRSVHKDLVEANVEADVAVGNSLVTMYSRCGSLAEAREVFDSMKQRDVVSWTAMLTGYAQNELGREALDIFNKMDVQPNEITLISAIDACSIAGDLSQGRILHVKARTLLGSLDGSLGNALVNMYSKCGSLEEARRVFWEVESRNVVCWSTLVAAHAHHGAGGQVLELLCDMCLSGVSPDLVTFVNILVGCSHAGLLDEGIWLFRYLNGDCNLVPLIKHYKCLIDLLARAGWVDEAAELVITMPFEADGDAWMALFSSFKTAADLEKGVDNGQQVVHCLAAKGDAPYVLLSNLCAQGFQD